MRTDQYPGQNDAGTDESRRSSRSALSVRAHIRDGRRPKFACTLMDLSTTGFRADAFGTLSVGDTVWVTLPGMQGMEATVAWRDNFTIGCRFRTPLHPATFDHLLRTLG